MNSYHLWCIGCQMNRADAASIQNGLEELGLFPAPTAELADLVVLVTCVVRQSAEDRVVARLSALKHVHRRRPHTVVTVIGCYVHDQDSLQRRFPFVEAFFRPSDVEGLLQFARQHSASIPTATGEGHVRRQPRPPCSFVPIVEGCDHHCTYCIVRLRRGGQRSRSPRDILTQVQGLVSQGARDIALLGQNVDTYGQDLGPGAPNLADVLRELQPIRDLWRVRFLTSHPGDMEHELIRTVAGLPKVCPHFELPVQAGDDHVLQRMGRDYSARQYCDLVGTIRTAIPHCSIATDVIVGFPGEESYQFQRTYDLLESLRLDAVHIAKYSPRPGTPAAQLGDDVPEQQKEERRALLESLQAQISHQINAALMGRTVEVLVEGRQRGRWKGRTKTSKLVFFDDRRDWLGRLVHVRLTHAGTWSLGGELADA